MSQNKGVRIESPTISRMGPGDAGEQDSVKGCEIWPHGVDGGTISLGVSSLPWMTIGSVLQGVNHETGLPMAIVLPDRLLVRYPSV